MGIFNKLKNIFYDDVEVPEDEEVKEKPKIKKEEVKKEVIDIKEDKEPVIEELKFESFETDKIKPIKTESTFSERDLFKPERTFNFTQFDDDEEQEVKPRKNVIELERKNKVSYNTNPNINLNEPSKPTTIQPRTFKPSPVISPIYGILNKDYKKENVKERNSNDSFELSSEPRSYDSVRRKAYGTLEDTLSDTMITVKTEEIKTTVDNIDKDIDALEKTAKLEKIISEIEKSTDLTVGDLENKAAEISYEEKTTEIKLNKDIDSEEKKEENIVENTLTDNTLENDLFNLIDSMYDDKEE